jgi:hypothetical protein
VRHLNEKKNVEHIVGAALRGRPVFRQVPLKDHPNLNRRMGRPRSDAPTILQPRSYRNLIWYLFPATIFKRTRPLAASAN